MRTVKTVVVTLIVLAILVPVAGLAYIYSGAYNVAATVPHDKLTLWAIDTSYTHSVATRAQDIRVPPLTGKKMIRTGFAHYRENCARCHAGPGIEGFEGVKDMYPKPPNLAHSAREMTAGQLFWIIKHGVKMTGMPAWGPTHSDDKIWAMVAFLKQMPGMTAADYQRLDAAVPAEEHQHGDHDEHNHAGHGPGAQASP